ncbi:21320_t:CDS:2, partial [Racocetra persica]
MNHDPIVTHSKANSNIDESSSDSLDSSSSNNLTEFEQDQDIKNLDNLTEFERNQEDESFDTEMYDNLSISHNNENSTENIPITYSNKQQSSHVWKFFIVLATKQRKCNHCKRIFSNKTATSTLDQHIQIQHIGLYNNFCQTALDHYRRPKPYPYNIQEKKIALLLKWIVVNLQAFRVVENLHFKQFIFDLDPRFQLPCWQALQNLIISKFELQRTLIKNFIFNLSYENWNLYHLLLDVFEIPSSHTGQIISNIILSLLNDIIKNTLANNFSNSLFQHIRCAAYIINIAVKKGLKLANRYLIKLRYFIKKIRKSALFIEDLKRITASFDHPFLRPIIDCSTRWNSSFLMIDRLFNHLNAFNSNYQDINAVVSKIREKLDEYWPIMQEASKIAAFFDLHFKQIVYSENSANEILASICANLPCIQFLQEYNRTSMLTTTSDLDELTRYWEIIAPPEETS